MIEIIQLEAVYLWYYPALASSKSNIVFPKSTNPQHIRENMNIYDFALSEDEMRKIDIMDKTNHILFGRNG